MTAQPFGVNFHMFQPGAAQIVETLIEKKVAAVSFGRGPDKKMIARFKEAGIKCVPTIGAVRRRVFAVAPGRRCHPDIVRHLSLSLAARASAMGSDARQVV